MSESEITTEDRSDLARYEHSEPHHGHDGGVAHAIVQMLREGRAAIDLPLSTIHQAQARAVTQLLRLKEDPRLRALDQWPTDNSAELRSFVDGRSVAFAAVGEVRATGDTAVLTVTLYQTPSGENAEDAGREPPGLQKWRLKRVIQFVEERLSGPILLDELAEVAGLSPSRFGAQFRAATGLRPHEYILTKRIQRAQELLLGTNDPVIEIALGVGFQTQAHFTRVFGRLVGDTPFHWRQRRLMAPGRI